MYFSLNSSIVDERKGCLQRDLNTQPKKVLFCFFQKKKEKLFSVIDLQVKLRNLQQRELKMR